ncbi:replication initiator protein A [Paracoccus denitrificans]|jgi:plasmid replication initiation protein|uniref:Replication protein A n=1 Tax=Paracoccus denitrificans (strain Pd 1222) TaxID=318586 RepID=A1B6W6_PARDP|nr:replication initiator protein A [Paracoccus denitrificans]ABL71260.1 replication protein A [Paracoccus denitrificans PD1222]MBB4629918.1 plasmid replication initiation protein [Paracoccus denitrificans]MCU7431289.1 replication initiator protein A [Paracoccus denitrificans]QAR27895.1 replication protein A [Paracoccus denitrificans]UPV97609.1 replication initiator protein A [Paracoccus denitrificans]
MRTSRRTRLSGERRRLSPFVVTGTGGEVRPRDQRDLMERPFFSLAKTKRLTPIHYESGGVQVHVQGFPEHGMATIWDADVLIWAASQIVDAENAGLQTSRFLRFTPYQLLTAIGRQTGARDYRLLKGTLARLQSTVIRTTIRHGEHWRRHQFSWIGEWEEMTTAGGRVEGMEFVLPEWFYRGVLDRSLVLTIDPAYFRLKGGIERWLYRVARKHAGRQPSGWCFDIPHLHAKSGSLVRLSDFALQIRRIAQRQSLPGYRLRIERRGDVEMLRIQPVSYPQRLVDNCVNGIGTSDARNVDDIGTSHAGLSGLRTHGSQSSLWDSKGNPARNLSNLKDSNIVEARRAVDNPRPGAHTVPHSRNRRGPEGGGE